MNGNISVISSTKKFLMDTERSFISIDELTAMWQFSRNKYSEWDCLTEELEFSDYCRYPTNPFSWFSLWEIIELLCKRAKQKCKNKSTLNFIFIFLLPRMWSGEWLWLYLHGFYSYRIYKWRQHWLVTSSPGWNTIYYCRLSFLVLFQVLKMIYALDKSYWGCLSYLREEGKCNYSLIT